MPKHELPTPLPISPLELLSQWLDYAMTSSTLKDPNACALATVDPVADRPQPTLRFVLSKGLVKDPGYLIFYTNYRSNKGKALQNNPYAAATFYWSDLDRQARLEGPITKLDEQSSDAYFASRPWPSRLGAAVSQQSEPIGSRAAFFERLRKGAKQHGTPDPIDAPNAPFAGTIPRPEHWGGYCLWLEKVDLMLLKPYRLHDRACWHRALTANSDGAFDGDTWTATRLLP